MLEEYAGICGFTKEELFGQMMDYIDRLAEKQEFTREEAIAELTRKYDGYRTYFLLVEALFAAYRCVDMLMSSWPQAHG